MPQTYIAAQLKTGAADDDVEGFDQIKTASINRCDHTESICESRSCIESWAIDWRIYLNRTVIGRDWIKSLGYTDTDVHRLALDNILR